jgi:hypothetical protein
MPAAIFLPSSVAEAVEEVAAAVVVVTAVAEEATGVAVAGTAAAAVAIAASMFRIDQVSVPAIVVAPREKKLPAARGRRRGTVTPTGTIGRFEQSATRTVTVTPALTMTISVSSIPGSIAARLLVQTDASAQPMWALTAKRAAAHNRCCTRCAKCPAVAPGIWFPAGSIALRTPLVATAYSRDDTDRAMP